MAIEASQISPSPAAVQIRKAGRRGGGQLTGRRVCASSSNHKPVMIVCTTKKVYSSIGTQPRVMPVTSAGS